MRRRCITQLPLRRAFFFQQPHYLRAAICGLMYFEDGYNMPQQAKYLGVSVGTIHNFLHLFLDLELDAEDYLIAREKIREMRSILYATQW